MNLRITPCEEDIFRALTAFLVGVLPPGTQVFQGQANRVSEPRCQPYVVMWPILMPRLATNLNLYADAVYTGSIAGTTLTITAVDSDFAGPPLGPARTVLGDTVATGTVIVKQLTGAPPGGAGTYSVTPAQSVASGPLAAGVQTITQDAEYTIQCDVHGDPDQGTAGDDAQTISTLFRDDYAVTALAATGFDITPLYCGDPRQAPFTNGEQQVEDRYTVDLHLQVNQTITVPQEFAAQLETDVISVDASYPP